MKDFSTVLLINTLHAVLDHLQESPEIVQDSSGVKEFKRTLLEQIFKLQANQAGSQRTTADNARGGAMEFTDKILKCVDCGEHFVFSAGEQQFFSGKQFQHEPKHCKLCKAKARRGRPRVETSVICAGCGASTIVPFVPRQDRPVLCRSCRDQKPQIENSHEPASAGAA